MTPQDAFTRVVSGGYCIGCGACAARATGSVRIEMDVEGRYQAKGATVPDDFAAICPFSGTSANEDIIASERFTEARPHPGIGRYLSCYAGHAADPALRANGSSGGLTTWLVVELLAQGIVDKVIHVAPSDTDNLFHYTISTTPETAKSRAKSRYYPVEMSEVLAQVRREEGRYAVVGIPCFIKAINLLKRTDPVLDTRIRYTIGIFCGHLKSARFAEYLAAQVGVDRTDLSTLDFRYKYANWPASKYGVLAIRRDGTSADKPMNEIFGNNWGYGFFKYEACNACDDVAAETADIAFGDAWLPGFVEDPGGTNVVVVRHPDIAAIIQTGQDEGHLDLVELDADTIANSQAAGLRDRREGLAYRMALKESAGIWHPQKRVASRSDLPAKRVNIYRLRLQIMERTHTAWARMRIDGNLAEFESKLRPITDAYDALYKPSRWRRYFVPLRKILGTAVQIGCDLKRRFS